MATLSIKQQHHGIDKLGATAKVAAYMGIALLAALLFGLLLTGADWTLPMDPVIAASFTA